MIMFSKMDYKNLKDLWLVLLPLLTLIFIGLGASKKTRIVQALRLNLTYINRKTRFALTAIGLALIFFALLGPQQEVGVTETKGEGLDIYVLIDTSKSMLAEDVVPSRIDRSKRVVEEVINGIEGDRIGFIPYASSAYIQMPLTDDYSLASMFLNVVDTDMIGGGGTDVFQAISLASDSMQQTASRNQVMIIISDGEEHEVDMARIDALVKETGVKIYTIGVGTKEGGLIPVYDKAGSLVEYKKDQSDQLVMTRLDETLLKAIANKSGGAYRTSTAGMDEVGGLIEDLSRLEKAETSSRKIKEYQQLFQWFLGLGLVCLLLGIKLPERKLP